MATVLTFDGMRKCLRGKRPAQCLRGLGRSHPYRCPTRREVMGTVRDLERFLKQNGSVSPRDRHMALMALRNLREVAENCGIRLKKDVDL